VKKTAKPKVAAKKKVVKRAPKKKVVKKPVAKKAPVRKKVVKKRVQRKAPAKKAAAPIPLFLDIKEATPKIPSLCRSCHALPAGSVELVSLLLVLVFCLSAILLTTTYISHQSAAPADAQVEAVQ